VSFEITENKTPFPVLLPNNLKYEKTLAGMITDHRLAVHNPENNVRPNRFTDWGSELPSNSSMADARRRTSRAIVSFLVAVALVGSHLSYNKVGGPWAFRELIVMIIMCRVSCVNSHVPMFIFALFTAKREQRSTTKATSPSRL
jgi:hypothetical protein